MKQQKVVLAEFPFPIMFIMTDATFEKLSLVMDSNRKATSFADSFIPDDFQVDAKIYEIFLQKKESFEQFSEAMCTMIFRSYFEENFENENYIQLMKVAQKKLKLGKRITVIFAKDYDDCIQDMQSNGDPFVANADDDSTALFFLFSEPYEEFPGKTREAMVYHTQPEVFVEIPYGNKKIEVTNYTIDADIESLQKDLRLSNNKLPLKAR